MLDLGAIKARLDKQLKAPRDLYFLDCGAADVRALIAEVVRLRERLADSEQQASNAVTWQAAMVRAQAERDAETTRAVLAEDFADRVKTAMVDTEAAQVEVERLRAELWNLRAALVEVKAAAGAVCPNFATCDHAACAASYAAWHIADAALRGGDSGRE